MSQTHIAPIIISPNPWLATHAYPSLLSVELFLCTKRLSINGPVQKGNSIATSRNMGTQEKRDILQPFRSMPFLIVKCLALIVRRECIGGRRMALVLWRYKQPAAFLFWLGRQTQIPLIFKNPQKQSSSIKLAAQSQVVLFSARVPRTCF